MMPRQGQKWLPINIYCRDKGTVFQAFEFYSHTKNTDQGCLLSYL